MAWEDTDEMCESCGNIKKRAKGWNKQNLKRLFSFKVTADDLFILILIAAVILVALLYRSETATCKEFLSNFSYYCDAYDKAYERMNNLNVSIGFNKEMWINDTG